VPLWFILPLALAAGPARAQTELTRVFPIGARRGTRVTLTFAGPSLPETADLLVDGDGVRAVGQFTKGVGQVDLDAKAEPGVRQLRLVGPQGGTSPRPFAVGALPELAEQEPNDDARHAQRIDSLPVTLNGTLPKRTDVDIFRITLEKGACLVVAGESRALGAPTNLLVRIRDAQGRELAGQMDYRTRDPLLGFTAPADGDYLVELQEVMNNYSSVNDDYVYRVTLTTGPWLDAAFPPGAQRGKKTRLTLTGWNLGGHPGPSQVEEEIAVPPDAGPEMTVSAGGAPNRVRIAVGTTPETLAAGLRAAADPAPPLLAPPSTVNGVFNQRGEQDVFRFPAQAGETFLLEVKARDLGSFADPTLSIMDATGKTLVVVDDVEGSRDPRLYWTAPAAGEYRVALRDVGASSRSGSGFFYRLTVAPPAPEVRLATPSPTLLLHPGQKVELPLAVTQACQPAELTVRVEGLPPGVTATPIRLPGVPGKPATAQVKLELTAAANAPAGHAVIRVLATSAAPAPVTAPATASWVLSTDRSGTLARGTTDRLLLIVPAP
jgi:hypothetical protein